jgi:hypothetical protein
MPIFGTIIGKAIIDYIIFICLHPDFQEIFDRRKSSSSPIRPPGTPPSLVELEIKKRYLVLEVILSLQVQTVGTPWLAEEIDKITSMVYFAIVISTFIFLQVSIRIL